MDGRMDEQMTCAKTIITISCDCGSASWTKTTICLLLIHEANPQSQPVVITVFTHVIRPYFNLSGLSIPTFQILAKQNNFHVKIMIATGRTVGWPSGSLMTPVERNLRKITEQNKLNRKFKVSQQSLICGVILFSRLTF